MLAQKGICEPKTGEYGRSNKRLHARQIPLRFRAMTFYKAAFAWLAVAAALGWGIYRTVAPENPSWTPFLLVTLAFIVLVTFTGCKVDEPDADHH